MYVSQKPTLEIHACSMEGNNQEKAATDEYFRSLPPGYRFNPTDQELILHYLKPKILNEPLPRNRIRTLNIYDFHPKELTADPEFEKIREDGWYFFSTRKRKYQNGERPSRKADVGFWKSTGTKRKIKLENNQVIGQKNGLDYRTGDPPNGTKSDWKMLEYVLAEEYIPLPKRKKGEGDMELDLVLSKIYMNTRANGTEDADDEEMVTDTVTSHSNNSMVADQAQHLDSSLIYSLQPQVHNNNTTTTGGFNHLDHIPESSSTPENGFYSSPFMSNGIYDSANGTNYGEYMNNGASSSVYQWGSTSTQLHHQNYFNMYSEQMPSSSTLYLSYEHPMQYSPTEIREQLQQPVNHEMSQADDSTLASLPAHVIEYNSMLVNNKDEAEMMPFMHQGDEDDGLQCLRIPHEVQKNNGDDGLQYLSIPDEVHENDSKTGEDDPKTG